MDAAPAAVAWLVAIQAASAFAMTGIIWSVQAVQYPGFSRLSPEEFVSFHAHHCRAIGWVVGPLMAIELLSGMALAVAGEPLWFWRCMLAALVAIWISTAFWQAPLHARLSREGARAGTLRLLVRSNWLRTIFWSARSAALIWFYARG